MMNDDWLHTPYMLADLVRIAGRFRYAIALY